MSETDIEKGSRGLGELGNALEGIKVEALGAPLPGGSAMTIGTDDENYPGIFRPLFPKD